jgi:hypothetical protein
MAGGTTYERRHKGPAKAAPAKPGSASMCMLISPAAGSALGTKGMPNGLHSGLENRLAGATP